MLQVASLFVGIATVAIGFVLGKFMLGVLQIKRTLACMPSIVEPGESHWFLGVIPLVSKEPLHSALKRLCDKYGPIFKANFLLVPVSLGLPGALCDRWLLQKAH